MRFLPLPRVGDQVGDEQGETIDLVARDDGDGAEVVPQVAADAHVVFEDEGEVGPGLLGGDEGTFVVCRGGRLALRPVRRLHEHRRLTAPIRCTERRQGGVRLREVIQVGDKGVMELWTHRTPVPRGNACGHCGRTRQKRLPCGRAWCV